MAKMVSLGTVKKRVHKKVPRARVAVERALRDRQALCKMRMGLSLITEIHNIAKNSLDHAVRIAENFYFGQDYLDSRLAAYRGQKKAVFLYHGFGQGRPSFERFERFLTSPLFDLFPIAGGYSPYSQDIRISAEYELKVIEQVLQKTDIQEVYLLGHSQGGILVRYMMQELQVPKVKRCVFLATPHRGTWSGLVGYLHRPATLALRAVPKLPAVYGESSLQLLPNSKLINRLNSLELPPDVEYTSLYNYLDPFILPARYGRLPYPQAHNILMMKIGHYHPLYDHQDMEIVLRALVLGQSAFANFRQEILGGQEVLDNPGLSQESGAKVFITSSD